MFRDNLQELIMTNDSPEYYENTIEVLDTILNIIDSTCEKDFTGCVIAIKTIKKIIGDFDEDLFQKYISN